MPDTVIAYVTHVDRPNISSASNRQGAKWRGGACLSKNGGTFCGCFDKCHRSGHDKRSTTKHKHASFTAHRETIQSRLKVKNDRCIAVSSFLDISVHCSLPGNKRQVSGAITLAAGREPIWRPLCSGAHIMQDEKMKDMIIKMQNYKI